MIPVILVVDSDASILELVRGTLARGGYRVLTASTGAKAQMIIETTPVDLLMLDRILPDCSGLDLCRQFRDNSQAPVVFLTAQYDESDHLAALEAGADDYLTQPLSPKDLIARVRSYLRWTWQAAGAQRFDEKVTVGPLALDLAGRSAAYKGKELRLTPMEFEILLVLARAPGRAFSREQLHALASGQELASKARNIDVHIRSLRLKLEENPACPCFLETVRGSGYCLGRRA